MPHNGSLLAAALALVTMTVSRGGNPLAPEVGRSRPLVLVAPASTDPAVSLWDKELSPPQARAELAERQVVVFAVVAGHGRREDGSLDARATAALLAALGLRADGPPVALLVGKDGGVKLRRSRLSVAEIVAAIDRMPMRRREMRAP